MLNFYFSPQVPPPTYRDFIEKLMLLEGWNFRLRNRQTAVPSLGAATTDAASLGWMNSGQKNLLASFCRSAWTVVMFSLMVSSSESSPLPKRVGTGPAMFSPSYSSQWMGISWSRITGTLSARRVGFSFLAISME
jgi:hypothetical protein